MASLQGVATSNILVAPWLTISGFIFTQIFTSAGALPPEFIHMGLAGSSIRMCLISGVLRSISLLL